MEPFSVPGVASTASIAANRFSTASSERRARIVAVCCSSASVKSVVRWRSSLSSRAFSMAMMAWAAKFVTSAMTPTSSLSLSIGTATIVRMPPISTASTILG